MPQYFQEMVKTYRERTQTLPATIDGMASEEDLCVFGYALIVKEIILKEKKSKNYQMIILTIYSRNT
jgi:hypothetical protein